MLVWAVTGSVSVTLGSSQWSLGADQALWIPGGHRAVLRGTEGACLVPIRVRDADRAAGPSAPFLASVPATAASALIAAFTRSLGVLHGGGVRAAAILSVIGHPTTAIAVPSMPASLDLRRVADELLADPSRSPAEVGAVHGLSESTLTRRFREETGCTPLRWRIRHALGRAAEQLRTHRSIATVAASAGYGSPQAFARAFRRESGISPAAVATDIPTTGTVGRRGAELGPQRNGYHIVIWIAAGSAVLHIDGSRTPLRAGDIACLPAGASVGLQAAADAAMVPLGWLPGGVATPASVITQADENHREQLLRLAAWAYADVLPLTGGEPRAALQAALGLAEPQDITPAIVEATYALLERLADHPEDGCSTAELAARLGITPRELRDAIEALTGTTLATWRARLRMSWSRRLLRDGMHASQVAARIGYADATAFSRAFRHAHGDSPTRFQTDQRHATPR